MIVFTGAVVASVLGLAQSKRVRDSLPLVMSGFLLVAMIVTPFLYTPEKTAEANVMYPQLGLYVKMIVCGMGILLAMLGVKLIDRKMEAAVAEGRASFDSIRANRGEYFAFFMLSLMGDD